jgi:predicted Zn-dependent protease
LRPRSGRSRKGCLGNGRLLLALAVAGMALFSYFGSKQLNPVTGEEQYISISQEQEIALGLQAAPQLSQQFGGLYPDQEIQNEIDALGFDLVNHSFAARSDYPFEFHLLADQNTVNAFALPGGQVFMTTALLERLETIDQVAGVLAHEIVHVLGRHGAEQMAKQELTQGLSGAVVLATYDPNDPKSQGTAQVALMIGQLVNMKFGREAELEADQWGVCIMHQAGYEPLEMIRVMEILDEATIGGRPPEFFSTHPDPGNRIEGIKTAIQNVDQCP